MSHLARAINPHQYDDDTVRWDQVGLDQNSPTRANFLTYLEPYLQNLRHKAVLDIGAGTGWLSHLAASRGANPVVAVEPAHKNVIIAQRAYPEIEVFEGKFEDFETETSFDLVLSVMSLVHIFDLDNFFVQLGELLMDKGEFIAIVPDYDYFRTPRFDYQLEVEEIDPDEYVVTVTRATGPIADLVRRNRKYLQAAEAAGFRLLEVKPCVPSQSFMNQEPKYRQFKDVPLFQLLRFGW